MNVYMYIMYIYIYTLIHTHIYTSNNVRYDPISGPVKDHNCTQTWQSRNGGVELKNQQCLNNMYDFPAILS